MRKLFLLITIIPLALSAQEKWSLARCIQYAQAHHPNVSIAKEGVKISKQVYREAIGTLLPTMDTQVTAGLNYGNSRDYISQAMTSNNTFTNQYTLNARLTIFDGLSSIYQLRMRNIEHHLSKNRLNEEIDLLSYNIVESYLNLSYYSQLVELGVVLVEASKTHLKKSSRMEELGLVGLIERIEAEAKLAEDIYFLTQQRNSLKLAKILLKEKMNFPIEEELIIEANFNQQQINIAAESPLSIYNKAISYIPKAVYSQNEVNKEHFALKSSKGLLFPKITMDVGISTNYFKYMNNSDAKRWSWSNQFSDNRGEYIQFTLSIPIYNGFKRISYIKRARANLNIAKFQQLNIQNSLYRDIEQTVADVNGQVDDYLQASKQVSAMEIAHQLNLKKYDEGLIDPLQLNISANRLLQAQVAKLKSLHTYILKYKLYRYYLGIPYDNLN